MPVEAILSAVLSPRRPLATPPFGVACQPWDASIPFLPSTAFSFVQVLWCVKHR